MPLLIDLCAGEGGAAVGYAMAGWKVVGFDVKPNKRYPFPLIVGDVRKIDRRWLELADAVHASPPCQFGSELTPAKARANHVNLIPEIRAMLQEANVPYVIENVRRVKEHLIDPVSLFGTMFGLHMRTSAGRAYVLSRERCFETNWGLVPPAPVEAKDPIANIYGGHLRCRDAEHRTGKGTGRTMDFIGEDKPALARQLMDMPWASMVGMSEAVPPAYTRFIGNQMRARVL